MAHLVFRNEKEKEEEEEEEEDEEKKRAKEWGERERERGIKAARNPPAISERPIGRRTDARWKGFGDSTAQQEKRTEGVAREVSLVHGRSTDAAYRFYFYPQPSSRSPLFAALFRFAYPSNPPPLLILSPELSSPRTSRRV